jgi:hypothetical protein
MKIIDVNLYEFRYFEQKLKRKLAEIVHMTHVGFRFPANYHIPNNRSGNLFELFTLTRILFVLPLVYARPRFDWISRIHNGCAKHEYGIGIGPRRITADTLVHLEHLTAADQQHLMGGRYLVQLFDGVLQRLYTVGENEKIERKKDIFRKFRISTHTRCLDGQQSN